MQTLKSFSHLWKNKKKNIRPIHKNSFAWGKILSFKYINETIKSQLTNSQWIFFIIERKSFCRPKGPDYLASSYFSQLTLYHFFSCLFHSSHNDFQFLKYLEHTSVFAFEFSVPY